MATQPEPWMRGPLAEVNPLLAPVLYSFQQAREDLAAHTAGLTPGQLWSRPFGFGSAAFHILHIAGSIDRLITYLQGEQLSAEQLAALEAEKSPQPAAREALLEVLERALAAAESVVRTLDLATLPEPREVGRRRLPTTVIGLLTHIAEHTQRHVGQAISAAKLAARLDSGTPFGRIPNLRLERLLATTAANAWDLLTDPVRLPAWYGAGATIEPRAGGVVRLLDGHIRGVVTQWLPPRRLAYTWNVFAPGESESPYPESYLTLELAPAAEAVRLVLTHLPVLERFEKQNAMGWHTFLDMVEAAARGDASQPREVYMQRNAALYGVDLNALAR